MTRVFLPGSMDGRLSGDHGDIILLTVPKKTIKYSCFMMLSIIYGACTVWPEHDRGYAYCLHRPGAHCLGVPGHFLPACRQRVIIGPGALPGAPGVAL